MRINQYIAQATGLSRRAADEAIADGRVKVNAQTAKLGYAVRPNDQIALDGQLLTPAGNLITIMLNKPRGYVCSRNGQGNQTIYDLLPPELHHLKPVGRLDKDSSGLLLLTNDGQLANQLTHPRYGKEKVYEVELDMPLRQPHQAMIESGVSINNEYISRLRLAKNENRKLKIDNCAWLVTMSMGRNRQIRRTFAACGYKIITLHRVNFGIYKLDKIGTGEYKTIKI